VITVCVLNLQHWGCNHIVAAPKPALFDCVQSLHA
jgi:hypothetical protein